MHLRGGKKNTRADVFCSVGTDLTSGFMLALVSWFSASQTTIGAADGGTNVHSVLTAADDWLVDFRLLISVDLDVKRAEPRPEPRRTGSGSGASPAVDEPLLQAVLLSSGAMMSGGVALLLLKSFDWF